MLKRGDSGIHWGGAGIVGGAVLEVNYLDLSPDGRRATIEIIAVIAEPEPDGLYFTDWRLELVRTDDGVWSIFSAKLTGES